MVLLKPGKLKYCYQTKSGASYWKWRDEKVFWSRLYFPFCVRFLVRTLWSLWIVRFKISICKTLKLRAGNDTVSFFSNVFFWLVALSDGISLGGEAFPWGLCSGVSVMQILLHTASLVCGYRGKTCFLHTGQDIHVWLDVQLCTRNFWCFLLGWHLNF